MPQSTMERIDLSDPLSASLAALSVEPHPTASSGGAHSSGVKLPAHSHPHQQSPVSPPSALSAATTTSTACIAPVDLPACSPLSPSSSERDCLRRFLAVQEYRALTYSAWQAAFRTYLASAHESDLLAFTAHCQHVTAAFQQLSLQVKLCIAQLQRPNSEEWAQQLQAVQRLEKEKLGLTVAMQELSSEWVIRRQEPFSGELQQQLMVRRRRMDEVVEAINDILTEAKYEVRYKKQQ